MHGTEAGEPEIAHGEGAHAGAAPLRNRSGRAVLPRAPERGDTPTAVRIGRQRPRRGSRTVLTARRHGIRNHVRGAPEEVAVPQPAVARVLVVNGLYGFFETHPNHELPV